MRIAVEFDGTIVKNRYPEIGQEYPMASFILSYLIEKGHEVILFTHRSGKELEAAVKWCKERDVNFYAINKNHPNEKIESGFYKKIDADYFIDGKNLGGIPQWNKIYSIFQPEETDFVKLRFKYERAKLKRKLKEVFH